MDSDEQVRLGLDTRKGNRPSFAAAAPQDRARVLYTVFCDQLQLDGVADVQTGDFGARMLVEIANDGPVTILLEA